MNTCKIIMRRLASLFMCFFVLNTVAALEVTIDGLKYDLKGTSATVLSIANGNTQTSIVVPESIEYSGYTYEVNALADFCFSNIRFTHYTYENKEYWNYDWSLNGRKANGSDQFDDHLPSALQTAFPIKGTFNYNAYLYNSYVTSIILGESIQTIGQAAFFNTNLTDVVLKEGITEIPIAAFALSKISNIKLPKSITKINSHAFCNSQLSKISLNEGLEEISDYAFAETPIIEVCFPQSLKKLGKHLFDNSDLLRKLTYLGIKPNTWYSSIITIVPDNTWDNASNIYPMITWNYSEFLYNGQTPSLTWTNNMNGYMVNMDIPQLHTDAGTWKAEIPVTFTKDDEIIKVKAVCQYSITPAPLTITASDANRQYYSENPTFSYTCNGFVNGESEAVLSTAPKISTSANLSSNVGKYEIIVAGASSPNYSISFVNGTLMITPRTLTASVGNYERLYNEENPNFDVHYLGFIGNEDESVLNERATASTTATKTSDVGMYPISVTGGSANNYDFSYNPGTLIVNKAEQMLSWDQDLTNLHVGDQIELEAVASSGLPITYMMDSDDKAEIYTVGTKQYMDCLTIGSFMIRAVQNGNQNYEASPRASQTVIINGNAEDNPILTIIQAENGAVSTKVNKGSKYTFTVTAWEGWKIHSVTFNDEDVTDQLDEGGTFTTPAINEDATLNVAYEEDGGNVVKALSSSSAVKIQGTSFGARVTGANHGDMIQVYTLDGVLQKSIKADEHVIDIPLTDQKVYILKVGDKTVKLSI